MTAVYSLVMFPAEGSVPHLSLKATIGRQPEGIGVRFSLAGDLAELLLPPQVENCQRRDGLWQTTCLECFLAEIGSTSYWEINLAPSGHWNVYRFSDYRQGMVREEGFDHLASRQATSGGGWHLTAILPHFSGWRNGTNLAVGLSAVIACLDGRRIYWALAHPGAKPDFHNRDSFIGNIA